MKKTTVFLIGAALTVNMMTVPVSASSYNGALGASSYYVASVNAKTDSAAAEDRKAISGIIFYSVKNGSGNKPVYVGEGSMGVYSNHENLDIPKGIKQFITDKGLDVKSVTFENGVLKIDYNEFGTEEIAKSEADIREAELLATIYSCPLIKTYEAVWNSALSMKDHVQKDSSAPHYGVYTRTASGFTLEYEDAEGEHKEERKMSGVAAWDDGIPCTDDVLLLYTGSATAFNSGQKQFIDGENPNVKPVVLDGRTLVPVRYICETFDGTVDWKELTKTVSIKIGRNDIKFTINKNNMIVNVASKPLDVPAQIIDGRTMVPLRALVEAIGLSVEYYNGLIVIGPAEYVENVKSANLDLVIDIFYKNQ